MSPTASGQALHKNLRDPGNAAKPRTAEVRPRFSSLQPLEGTAEGLTDALVLSSLIVATTREKT